MMSTEERGAEGAPSSLVKHYSVREVAEAWGVSTDVVRRIFEHEPGVVILKNKGLRRMYRVMRIPAHIVERVHKRLAGE
jgi:hypothetical protein